MLLEGAALLESWLPFGSILYSSQEGEVLTPLPLTWWVPQEVLCLCNMFPAGKTSSFGHLETVNMQLPVKTLYLCAEYS